jgi:phage virion morphogenesis protein
MATDSLQQLEDWAAPLLARLGPAEQRKLVRSIATDLRRRQMDRIGKQRNPDGSKYAARKKVRPPVNKPQRFLYEGDYSSKKRIAEVKSYRDEGDRIIGYDIEAGGIRTFIKSNMERFFAPTSSSGKSIRAQSGRIKAMFRRMKTKVKVLPDPGSATVGIVGRAARIAHVHQYGLRDAVKPGGKVVQYPERVLLGFTDGDIERVRDLLLEHLAQ